VVFHAASLVPSPGSTSFAATSTSRSIHGSKSGRALSPCAENDSAVELGFSPHPSSISTAGALAEVSEEVSTHRSVKQPTSSHIAAKEIEGGKAEAHQQQAKDVGLRYHTGRYPIALEQNLAIAEYEALAYVTRTFNLHSLMVNDLAIPAEIVLQAMYKVDLDNAADYLRTVPHQAIVSAAAEIVQLPSLLYEHALRYITRPFKDFAPESVHLSQDMQAFGYSAEELANNYTYQMRLPPTSALSGSTTAFMKELKANSPSLTTCLLVGDQLYLCGNKSAIFQAIQYINSQASLSLAKKPERVFFDSSSLHLHNTADLQPYKYTLIVDAAIRAYIDKSCNGSVEWAKKRFDLLELSLQKQSIVLSGRRPEIQAAMDFIDNLVVEMPEKKKLNSHWNHKSAEQLILQRAASKGFPNSSSGKNGTFPLDVPTGPASQRLSIPSSPAVFGSISAKKHVITLFRYRFNLTQGEFLHIKDTNGGYRHFRDYCDLRVCPHDFFVRKLKHI